MSQARLGRPFTLGLFTDPFPCTECDMRFSALNAFAVVMMLSARSTATVSLVAAPIAPSRMLTARNDNPDEIHEEEIEPEVICLRSAVCQALVIVVKHAGGIV